MEGVVQSKNKRRLEVGGTHVTALLPVENTGANEEGEIYAGLGNLAYIGWVMGEVKAGNMGVTEVFGIFEQTGFHKNFLTNQLYRMLLELTLRALERPDARQLKIAKQVSEWGTGEDFSASIECRGLRDLLLRIMADVEEVGVPKKRAKAKTGDNRKKK